ncbi:hypothetical protein HON86_03050 [Candidatus Woesearchaeota archaeon]|mgnify:FL=1|jgi:hypothetical protein|nr:hypothetical protein [Candidatus Woesearchaeota archaeon]MBT4835568.1 hypothetical protein [Candidatus Woesearchaeota archaeon]MBT6734942.1 hypothetical protein [Candidatus Woesearchaeota archaeon]MBT7169761.1 hypothetical protein [Candidatus Woesearchaeota archaeon]MBT7474425.1 hypothetical protein [Candidatus Woesearchaeota archaeon]
MIDYQSLEKLIEEENTPEIGTLFTNLEYSLENVKESFGEHSRELEHYERYLADQIMLERESQPIKRKRRKPNGIGFKIRGYDHAEEIIKYSQNEESLRTLIYDVTRDSDLAKSLDYRGLKHQYHRIAGLAKTILSHKKQ